MICGFLGNVNSEASKQEMFLFSHIAFHYARSNPFFLSLDAIWADSIASGSLLGVAVDGGWAGLAASPACGGTGFLAPLVLSFGP